MSRMRAKTVTERPRFMMIVAATVVVCMLSMMKYCVPNAANRRLRSTTNFMATVVPKS